MTVLFYAALIRASTLAAFIWATRVGDTVFFSPDGQKGVRLHSGDKLEARDYGMPVSLAAASANASGPHGYQSTGLAACWRR